MSHSTQVSYRNVVLLLKIMCKNLTHVSTHAAQVNRTGKNYELYWGKSINCISLVT